MGNWTLPVALAGVKPMDPTRMGLATGPYEVTILDSDAKASNDPTKPPNVVFDVQVTEPGEFTGATTSVFMGTDMSKKGNQGAWKALLLGIGATPAQVEQPITVGPQTFNGKKAYLYVVERDPNDKQSFENRNFITKEKYLSLKASPAAHAAPAAAPTAAIPSNGAIPQPGGVGGLAAALGAPAAAPAGGISFGG